MPGNMTSRVKNLTAFGSKTSKITKSPSHHSLRVPFMPLISFQILFHQSASVTFISSMTFNNFPHSELLNSSQKVLMQLGSLQEKHSMFLRQLGIKQLYHFFCSSSTSLEEEKVYIQGVLTIHDFVVHKIAIYRFS